MIRSYGVSDSGAVRHKNEDCFVADDRLSLFVVADGMGGHAAGEVASRLAVESIVGFIDRSHERDDLSWPCGLDPTLTQSGNRVRTAIQLAHRRVWQEAEDHVGFMGMGTTVVCALIRERHLAVGHVGDSRLYAFSKEYSSSRLAMTPGQPRCWEARPLKTRQHWPPIPCDTC